MASRHRTVLAALALDIDQTLNDDTFTSSSDEDRNQLYQLISLQQHIARFLDFMEHRPDEARLSEKQIGEIASRAEILSYSDAREMDEMIISLKDLHRHPPPPPLHRTGNYSSTDDQVTGGVDDNYLEIIELITTAKSSNNLRVIPFIGIGRTSLARRVYGYQLIRESFDALVWVRAASQGYDLGEMLCKNLLESVDSYKGGASGDERHLEVNRYLHGRRFLVVLDDVRSLEVWYEFRRLLPSNSGGSCVLLTTCANKVAIHPDFMRPFHHVELVDSARNNV